MEAPGKAPDRTAVQPLWLNRSTVLKFRMVTGISPCLGLPFLLSRSKPPPECCPEGSSTARRPITGLRSMTTGYESGRSGGVWGGCGGESRAGAFTGFGSRGWRCWRRCPGLGGVFVCEGSLLGRSGGGSPGGGGPGRWKSLWFHPEGEISCVLTCHGR